MILAKPAVVTSILS